MSINGINCISYRETIAGLFTAHETESGKIIVRYEPNGLFETRKIEKQISPPLERNEYQEYTDKLKARIIEQFNRNKFMSNY